MSYNAVAQDAVSLGLAALATLALFAPLPGRAQTPTQAITTVPYADLDLTSEAGQDTLNKRIRGAVKRVCGPIGPSARETSNFNACKRQAYADARGKMRIAVAKAGERKALGTSLALAAPRAGMR